MSYSKDIEALNSVVGANKTWHDIDPEAAVRMRLQNRFKTHLDIAKYNAKIMREDMAAYDGFYRKLIAHVQLTDVSSSFAMEEIKFTTALPLPEANDA